MKRQAGGPEAGRKPARPILLILAIALIHGLLYTFVVPPWQHYDEPNHFEYAWLIANRGQLPQPGDVDLAMRRAVADSMFAHGFFRGLPPELYDPRATEPAWIGHYSQLGDPPLHYLLAALPLVVFQDADITVQLYLTRLVSLVLFLLTVAAAWAATGELVGEQNALRWLVPLTMALIPSFVDLMTSMNSDVSATAFFTLFLWASLRMLHTGNDRVGLVANGAFTFFAALLCVFTKQTVYVALPLLLPVFLLALFRGRWHGLGWSLLGTGAFAVLIGLFWSPIAGAAWYVEGNQAALSRQMDESAPLGKYIWAMQSSPGQSASRTERFRQLIPSNVLASLAGQEVTLGAWMWASEPVLAASPQVYIHGSAVSDISQHWPLDVQPSFHSFTFTIPPGAYSGWVNLIAQANAPGAVQIYVDGLILAAGVYPPEQTPVFNTDGGEIGWWGGLIFHNLLRNPSAESTCLGINSFVDLLSSRLLPDRGRISLIWYTVCDWPAGDAYYRSAATNLFRTFWAKFGWGNVLLRMDAVYGLLVWAMGIGLVGALGLLAWHWRRLPYAALTCLALGLVLIWGNAVVRGAIYIFQVNPFIPSARYAFPALFPTILILTAGWCFVGGLLQKGLRLPGRFLAVSYLLAFGLLDVLALVSIVQFYA